MKARFLDVEPYSFEGYILLTDEERERYFPGSDYDEFQVKGDIQLHRDRLLHVGAVIKRIELVDADLSKIKFTAELLQNVADSVFHELNYNKWEDLENLYEKL